MPRRPLSRGLLAGSAALLALALPLGGASFAAGEPATQKQGARTVAVSESANLPDTDAGITVTGSGFDPTVDVYVAVCRADIAESDPLTECLGGPIPDENDTTGWAEVTSEPEGKRNAAAFAADGSFRVDLTLASAADPGVDCVTEGCVLLVRSAGEGSDRPRDISIGLGFAVPPSSTTESSTSEAPSTREPDTVALPDAYLGQQQTVVFSGFTPGEEVEVTVFSEPVNIDGVVATAGGVVAITFPITEALVPGVHTVQAIGSESGVIGLGTFTVVPAPVTTSASPESSTSASTGSSAPATTSSEPATTQSTTAAATTTPSTTSEAATPAEPADSGGSLAWLWVAIALLVVAIAVAVAVTTSRRRAQQLEQDRLDQEAELVGLAAAQPPVWPTGTGAPYTSPTQQGGYEPHDPGQSYGLLSGREGDGPALYSGQGAGQGPTERYEPPTRWVGPDEGAGDLPTTAIRPDQSGGSTPVPPPVAEPPGTQRFDPSNETQPPRTQQWAPFANEEEGDGEPPRRR
jgi:heme exporter protein D